MRVLESGRVLDSLRGLLWEDDVKTLRYVTGALRNVLY